MFQRKSRSAKSYQEEATTEKKPRTIKRNIIKEDRSKVFTGFSAEEIYQKIRERAYQIFERRGSQGDELSDWLQAEREIIAEINRNKSNLN